MYGSESISLPLFELPTYDFCDFKDKGGDTNGSCLCVLGHTDEILVQSLGDIEIRRDRVFILCKEAVS